MEGTCRNRDEAEKLGEKHMNIKVIGGGCDKCDALYANTLAAVQTLGIEADVEKVEDLIEIVMLGVMTVPAVMVDGKVISAGRVLKEKELIKLIKKHIH